MLEDFRAGQHRDEEEQPQQADRAPHDNRHIRVSPTHDKSLVQAFSGLKKLHGPQNHAQGAETDQEKANTPAAIAFYEPDLLTRGGLQKFVDRETKTASMNWLLWLGLAGAALWMLTKKR
jgi:hypothetical protein